MLADAPLQLLRQIAVDACTRPHDLVNALKAYMHERSFAESVGTLPQVSLEEIAPEFVTQPVVIQNSLQQNLFSRPTAPEHPLGSTPLTDYYALVLLLKQTEARTIVEFGTSYGHAALIFALNTPDDAVIYTTDYPERPAIGPIYKQSGQTAKIRQSYEMTSKWDLTALQSKVDFMFIDASHEYEDVLADSRKAFQLIKPGGIICWHDYTFKFRGGVVRALDELLSEGRNIRKIRYSNLAFYREPATGSHN